MSTESCVLNGPARERRALLLLLLLGLVVFGAGLGLRDPWPADEPRFALVARQMVDSGQWLFPMRGGELYPDKPPVFMWLIALFLKLTGSLRVAFLLPSLLAGLGSLALVFDAARRMWDRATAWRAGLLLLVTVQFTLQARTAQIDGLVTFCITLGVYGFLRFLLGGGWRWYYLGWAAAGLGVITKGVGVLALFTLVPALWTHRSELRSASWRAWLKGLAGPLVMLGVIGLWLAPMLAAVARSGDPAFSAYRDNILFHQTVTRYGKAWHHVGPWYEYFVQEIPLFWLPLSVFLPWLAPRWTRAAREGDRRVILLLGYLLLVLVFFSASPGKRGVYITPATPALAMLAAPFLPDLLARPWPRRIWKALAALLAFLALTAGAALALTPKLHAKLAKAEVDAPWPALLVLGALALLALVRFRRTAFGALAAVFGLTWIVLGFGIQPALNASRTPEALMRRVEAQVPAASELMVVSYKEQFLLFAHRPLCHMPIRMPRADQARLAAFWQAEGPGRWVMGPDKALGTCFDTRNALDLGARHGARWLLVPPGASRPEGLRPDDPICTFTPKEARR